MENDKERDECKDGGKAKDLKIRLRPELQPLAKDKPWSRPKPYEQACALMLCHPEDIFLMTQLNLLFINRHREALPEGNFVSRIGRMGINFDRLLEIMVSIMIPKRIIWCLQNDSIHTSNWYIIHQTPI